jgi:hypothetical protein
VPLWVYIALIVAGAWALLVVIDLNDRPRLSRSGYVGLYALMVVAFVGGCSALALIGELWRGNL